MTRTAGLPAAKAANNTAAKTTTRNIGNARIRVAVFDQLTAWEVYAIARLRQDVFVVEQQCAYPDLDGRDTESSTVHVLLKDASGTLIGYARVLDESQDASPRSTPTPRQVRIGRVLLDPTARGGGLADLIVGAALQVCSERFSHRAIVLDAQSPLARWYATFGFKVTGPEFLEDGIAHVPMERGLTA